jgi:two-component system, NarL family, response regulator NreC
MPENSTPPRGTPRSHRVAIIDDHPLIRRGLERLINSGARFTVCGEAGTAADALTLLARDQVEIAIVDIGLPDQNGINLTREIRKKFPHIRVLILSMHDDGDHARRALKAGATGYMVKNDAVEKIEFALEEISNGRSYISNVVAERLT